MKKDRLDGCDFFGLTSRHGLHGSAGGREVGATQACSAPEVRFCVGVSRGIPGVACVLCRVVDNAQVRRLQRLRQLPVSVWEITLLAKHVKTQAGIAGWVQDAVA